ncbi:MAG: hypothetical protein V7L01_11590 [Nostoc sp.]|uniref:hypothetical protein n=1 Tax=Nostoc sp. TaxID=1180 RepID=UPI002FF9FAC1
MAQGRDAYSFKTIPNTTASYDGIRDFEQMPWLPQNMADGDGVLSKEIWRYKDA